MVAWEIPKNPMFSGEVWPGVGNDDADGLGIRRTKG